MSESDYQRGYREGYRDGRRDAESERSRDARPAPKCSRTGKPIGSCGCDACEMPYGP